MAPVLKNATMMILHLTRKKAFALRERKAGVKSAWRRVLSSKTILVSVGAKVKSTILLQENVLKKI